MADQCRHCGTPMRPQRTQAGSDLPRHTARGLCNNCYSKHRRWGRLDDYPTIQRRHPRKVMVAAILGSPDASRAQIAARLGVSLNAVNLAANRWQRANVTQLRRDAGPLGWQERAACADTLDPETFYPDGHGKAGARRIEEAKAICADCPVRAACLGYAMAVEGTDPATRHGIWGGLDERERSALYRKGLSA